MTVKELCIEVNRRLRDIDDINKDVYGTVFKWQYLEKFKPDREKAVADLKATIKKYQINADMSVDDLFIFYFAKLFPKHETTGECRGLLLWRMNLDYYFKYEFRE